MEGFIRKIGRIGATGKAGSRIFKEVLDRGHEATAIVRRAAKITEENVKVLEKDVFALTANDLQAFDVVVNAFGALAGQDHLNGDGGNVFIDAMKGAPNTKLLLCGGSGRLFGGEEKT
ncbi:NAD(P)-dependent oxidoreductase, partial [Bacillus sp. S1-R2T1-FB]|uniref:NAD(P)-dependent oxidoreductase n=1 Tax=Bacillus sp. S1-R2T1-FB TaxID=1973493 RepID=UPI0015C5090E